MGYHMVVHDLQLFLTSAPSLCMRTKLDSSELETRWKQQQIEQTDSWRRKEQRQELMYSDHVHQQEPLSIT